jgi:hypothetical protein
VPRSIIKCPSAILRIDTKVLWELHHPYPSFLGISKIKGAASSSSRCRSSLVRHRKPWQSLCLLYLIHLCEGILIGGLQTESKWLHANTPGDMHEKGQNKLHLGCFKNAHQKGITPGVRGHANSCMDHT